MTRLDASREQRRYQRIVSYLHLSRVYMPATDDVFSWSCHDLFDRLDGFQNHIKCTKSTRSPKRELSRISLYFIIIGLSHSLQSVHDLNLGTLGSLIRLGEVNRDAVHTVSLIDGVRESLTLENVSEMSTTVCYDISQHGNNNRRKESVLCTANDLSPAHAECPVSVSSHCARDCVEVCWPAAPRIELVLE